MQPDDHARAVFHLTLGASAGLTDQHHAGVLGGMAAVAVASFAMGGMQAGRVWTMGDHGSGPPKDDPARGCADSDAPDEALRQRP